MSTRLFSTACLITGVLVASSFADGGLSQAYAINGCPDSVVAEKPEVPGMPNAVVKQIGSRCDSPGSACTNPASVPGVCKQTIDKGNKTEDCEAGERDCWCTCEPNKPPPKPVPPKPLPPKPLPPKPTPTPTPPPDGGPSDLALAVFGALAAGWLAFMMWRRRRG